MSGEDRNMDREDLLRRTAGSAAVALVASAGLERADAAQAALEALQQAPPRSPRGSLRAASAQPPASLDAAKATISEEFRIVRNIFDPLVVYDPAYRRLLPNLATQWQSNANATLWTLRLRSGVRFHDETRFDSSAVKKNLEYYQAEAGPIQGLLLPKFTAIDDSDPSVVRLTCATPAPDLLRNATILYMMSPASIDKGKESVSREPVGTGPFMFVRQSADTVQLSANTAYWGPGPYLSSLTFVTVRDKSKWVSALRAGDVDIGFALSPLAAESLRSDSKFKVVTIRSLGTGVLAFATTQRPLNDVRVRRAIAHAINLQELFNTRFAKGLFPAPSILPNDVNGFRAPTTRYPHSISRARALLKAAGHGDGVKLTLGCGSPMFEAEFVTQLFKAQLSNVGVELDIRILDPAAWAKQAYGANPLHLQYVGAFDLTGTPLFLTSGIWSSLSHYSGSDLKALITAINTLPDKRKRRSAIAAAQELWAKKMLSIPLFRMPAIDAHRATLRGYRIARDESTQYFGAAYLA